MAPRVQSHRALLEVLQTAKPNLRKAILKESDKSLIFAICEICDNLLQGNIPLSEAQRQQLKRFRTILRRLAQRGEGWQTKRQYLVQKGGGAFLPLLLSAVASILPHLFSK